MNEKELVEMNKLLLASMKDLDVSIEHMVEEIAVDFDYIMREWLSSPTANDGKDSPT